MNHVVIFGVKMPKQEFHEHKTNVKSTALTVITPGADHIIIGAILPEILPDGVIDCTISDEWRYDTTFGIAKVLGVEVQTIDARLYSVIIMTPS